MATESDTVTRWERLPCRSPEVAVVTIPRQPTHDRRGAADPPPSASWVRGEPVSPALTYRVEGFPHDRLAVISFRGRVDARTEPAFTDYLRTVGEGTAATVVLNLAHIDIVDDASLRAVVDTCRDAGRLAIDVRVIPDTAHHITRALADAGLRHVLITAASVARFLHTRPGGCRGRGGTHHPTR